MERSYRYVLLGVLAAGYAYSMDQPVHEPEMLKTLCFKKLAALLLKEPVTGANLDAKLAHLDTLMKPMPRELQEQFAHHVPLKHSVCDYTLKELVTGAGAIRRISFSRQGTYFFVLTGTTNRNITCGLYHYPSGHKIRNPLDVLIPLSYTLPGIGYAAYEFSKDEQFFTFCAFNGYIYTIYTQTGELAHMITPAGHILTAEQLPANWLTTSCTPPLVHTRICSIALHYNCSRIAHVNGDTITCYNIPAQTSTRIKQPFTELNHLGFTQGGMLLTLTHEPYRTVPPFERPFTIQLYDPDTGMRLTGHHGSTPCYMGVQLSNDTATYSVPQGDTLRIFSSTTLFLLKEIKLPPHHEILRVKYIPYLPVVLISALTSQYVNSQIVTFFIYDITTNTLTPLNWATSRLKHELAKIQLGMASSLAPFCSPTQHQILVREHPLEEEIQVSQDRLTCSVLTQDLCVALKQLTDGALVARLTLPDNQTVNHVTLHPKSQGLVVSSAQGGVYIWDRPGALTIAQKLYLSAFEHDMINKHITQAQLLLNHPVFQQLGPSQRCRLHERLAQYPLVLQKLYRLFNP